MFSPIGPPDHPRRIELIHSVVRPPLHCAEGHGIILEIVQRDKNKSPKTIATCACFPPGSLIKGEIIPVGGGRWHYSWAKADCPPIYLDCERFGKELFQRIINAEQNSQMKKNIENAKVTCGMLHF